MLFSFAELAGPECRDGRGENVDDALLQNAEMRMNSVGG